MVIGPTAGGTKGNLRQGKNFVGFNQKGMLADGRHIQIRTHVDAVGNLRYIALTSSMVRSPSREAKR